MQDSKVVRQIAAMDGRERERLRQFVDSPYFNRHVATQKLLAFILKELGKRAHGLPRSGRKLCGQKRIPDSH
jgi:hypothetical protein